MTEREFEGNRRAFEVVSLEDKGEAGDREGEERAGDREDGPRPTVRTTEGGNVAQSAETARGEERHPRHHQPTSDETERRPAGAGDDEHREVDHEREEDGGPLDPARSARGAEPEREGERQDEVEERGDGEEKEVHLRRTLGAHGDTCKAIAATVGGGISP
jgi:hypothetical protein